MSWELTATILGIAGIFAGVLLKIFKPIKNEDIKTTQDNIESLNKKVNSNYNNQLLSDAGIGNRIKTLENEIASLEDTIDEINNDRKKDTEKFESKIEKINELILRLLQDK